MCADGAANAMQSPTRMQIDISCILTYKAVLDSDPKSPDKAW